MPRLSIWNEQRGKDYKYIDRIVSEYFGVGGTAIFCHLFGGVYEQATPTLNADGTFSPGLIANSAPTTTGNVTSIQDPLFLENRDQSFDPTVYELRGIYNVGDADFDLRQFGMFLSNDTYFVEVHFNDMIATCGRKIMTGDVIELPHRRDEFLLNGGPAINAFFVVQDASWASDGYSVTWWQHIWRIKIAPMPASQEYNDILNQQAVNPLGLPQTNADGSPVILSNIMSDLAASTAINVAVNNNAVANFKNRYFETQQFWFIPGTTSELGQQNPWVFAGDGIPPNGAQLLGSGTSFPFTPNKNDYYLRTDYSPAVLYQFNGQNWFRQEIAWRGEWNVAHRYLKSFINNNATATNDDGTTAPEKVYLSKAITRPNIDF